MGHTGERTAGGMTHENAFWKHPYHSARLNRMETGLSCSMYPPGCQGDRHPPAPPIHSRAIPPLKHLQWLLSESQSNAEEVRCFLPLLLRRTTNGKSLCFLWSSLPESGTVWRVDGCRGNSLCFGLATQLFACTSGIMSRISDQPGARLGTDSENHNLPNPQVLF